MPLADCLSSISRSCSGHRQPASPRFRYVNLWRDDNWRFTRQSRQAVRNPEVGGYSHYDLQSTDLASPALYKAPALLRSASPRQPTPSSQRIPECDMPPLHASLRLARTGRRWRPRRALAEVFVGDCAFASRADQSRILRQCTALGVGTRCLPLGLTGGELFVTNV